MENVRFSDVDTPDEVCKTINRVVDNLNQVEGKVLQMVGASVGKVIAIREGKRVYGGVMTKVHDDGLFDVDFFDGDNGCYGLEDLACNRKGFITMKLLVFLVAFVLILSSVCYAPYTAAQITEEIAGSPHMLVRYLRDSFANQTGNYFTFTPTDTVPQTSEGRVYYHDTDNVLRLYTGSAWVNIDTAGGVTLDGAYNSGGSGVGRAITVDNGTVQLTATNAADDICLTLIQSDSDGSTAALLITSAGAVADDVSIDVDAQTTGRDFEGTNASCYITGAGIVVATSLDATGAAGLTLQNDETITNATDGKITFTTNGGTANTLLLDLQAGATAIQLESGDVTELQFGTVDSLTEVESITFNAGSTGLITLVSNSSADDLTISQTGSADGSVVITSAGTAANAIDLNTTAGGIDIDISGASDGEDFAVDTDSSVQLTASQAAVDAIKLNASAGGFDIDGTALASTITQTATGVDDNLTISVAGAFASSLILSSAGTGADAIDLNATAGGIDIDTVAGITLDISGASAGEDFAITTDSSIVLTSSEDAADAIDINASAGGIDIDATGELGQDIVITDTGGSIGLVQTEVVTDGINIDATGGVDIDSALDVAIDISTAASNFDVDVDGGSIYLDAGEEDAQAIWLAATGTASGIDIDAGTIGVDVDTTGPIALTSTENAADSIALTSTLGGIDIICSASDTENIDITNTGGSVYITSTENIANAIYLVANGNTASTIEIFNDTGTSATESAASIQLLSDLGAIELRSGLNGQGIHIVADGGTSESILINADRGTGAGSITLDSDAGGITILADGSANGDILIDAEDTIMIVSAAQSAAAITLQTNGSTSDTLVILASQGNPENSIDIDSTAGGLDVDVKKSIFLTSIANAADAIVLQSTIGGIDIRCDASDGEPIDISNADGAVNISSTHDQDATINISTSNGAGQIVINSADTTTDGIEVDSLGGMEIDCADDMTFKLTTSTDAEDFTIEVDGDDDASIILTSDGTGINAIELTTSAATGDIDINAGDAITIDAGDISFVTDDAVANQFKVDATGAVSGDAVNIETTDGGIYLGAEGGTNGDIRLSAASVVDVDANDDIMLTVTSGSAGEDLLLAQSGLNDSSISLISQGTGTDAIKIQTTGFLAANSGDIDIDSVDAITIDANNVIITTTKGAASDIYLHENGGASGTIMLRADQGTSTTANAGSIQLLSDLGGIGIAAAGVASKDAIRINAGTGGGINIDATEDIDILVTAGTSGEDLLLEVDGSQDSHITLKSDGTSIDAIYLHQSTATGGGIKLHADDSTNASAIHLVADAGGINIDVAGGKVFDLDAGTIQLDSATAGAGCIALTANQGTSDTITIINTLGTANGAITLTSTAGGIDFNGGSGADITIDTSKSVTIQTTETAADQFKVDAQGAASGNAINLETTNGGIVFTADGTSDGGILVDANTILTLQQGDHGGIAVVLPSNNVFVIEGGTVDGFETTLAVEDPTVDRTITFPDHTGGLPLVLIQADGDDGTYKQDAYADVNEATITLPAGWFGAGKSIKITVAGTVSAGNGAIFLALQLEDAEKCELTTADGATGDFIATWTVYATSTTAQRITGVLVAEAGVETIMDYDTDSQAYSSQGNIDVRAKVANETDVITVKYILYETWTK